MHYRINTEFMLYPIHQAPVRTGCWIPIMTNTPSCTHVVPPPTTHLVVRIWIILLISH